MEWVTSLKQSIDFIEKNLLEDITADDVAKDVSISPFYLQRGFMIMTGYTIGEYIRNRRLYMAALDIITGNEKVIDIAYKYGYETPESFTKAFTRFHNASPMGVRKDRRKIKAFLPLKISITITGGENMDYTIEKLEEFKVIGYSREFSFDNSYNEIPKFWDEIYSKKVIPLMSKPSPETDEEKAIMHNCIGELGVCIDNVGNGNFTYMIAGKYNGGEVPEGMKIYSFPNMDWAKFSCVGPMPGALQAVNTKVFKEWLPGNKEYDIAMGANIEWYSGDGNTSAADYKSAIWLPVKKK